VKIYVEIFNQFLRKIYFIKAFLVANFRGFEGKARNVFYHKGIRFNIGFARRILFLELGQHIFNKDFKIVINGLFEGGCAAFEISIAVA
jgi:hypothetical protein